MGHPTIWAVRHRICTNGDTSVTIRRDARESASGTSTKPVEYCMHLDVRPDGRFQAFASFSDPTDIEEPWYEFPMGIFDTLASAESHADTFADRLTDRYHRPLEISD